MKSFLQTVAKAALAVTLSVTAIGAVPLAVASAAPAVVAAPMSSGDGTAAGAVAWYQAHNGSTAYQGYCEKAAENAYGTTGVWASANAHWNGASPKHAGDKNPPLGAFVYWNISAYGHVGISDGAGGFWASSVNGRIGHVTKAMGGVNYFNAYRGWTPAARPHQ
ncbi:hypothetical protein [Kutzneria sp. 744]|uniref:hypothetical protein n=1 Tax=Kutzneria sp. (strain 744) TaxID=345341 RepID=UPI0003EED1B7|nr:hypothetical protein [Kutzneria sp. 744]EWM16083.1 hypothetical protein KUTG_06387 [Kutzneria sp. 744]